jgi:hypothetical protein
MNRQTTAPITQTKVAPGRTGILQRKCACGTHTTTGGACDACSKKNEATALQRSAVNHEPMNEAPPIVHDVLRSSGQPLDESTRAFFEPRFGHDFSSVRVHADGRAAESAQAVKALAYTVGHDIAFNAGQYSPGTAAGQRLLAHELTHVVQQSYVYNSGQPKSRFSDPSDAAEVEADIAAKEISTNSPLLALAGLGGETLPRADKNAYGRSMAHVSPAVIYRKERLWPLNGYVINHSSKPVTVWNDKRNIFTIAAGGNSDRFCEDVDHIKDEQGQWYKIGANTVTVDTTGKIDGYKCKVSNFNEDCPTLEKQPRSLAPPMSTGIAPRVNPEK